MIDKTKGLLFRLKSAVKDDNQDFQKESEDMIEKQFQHLERDKVCHLREIFLKEILDEFLTLLHNKTAVDKIPTKCNANVLDSLHATEKIKLCFDTIVYKEVDTLAYGKIRLFFQGLFTKD